jgi:hypothetical protein
MTFNLQSKSQVLLIFEALFLFTQAVIIINVVNFNVEEIDILFFETSDQVMISFNIEVSLFESSIHMFFKSVILLISVAFTESKIISSVLTFNDHMKEHHLNSMKTLAHH